MCILGITLVTREAGIEIIRQEKVIPQMVKYSSESLLYLHEYKWQLTDTGPGDICCSRHTHMKQEVIDYMIETSLHCTAYVSQGSRTMDQTV